MRLEAMQLSVLHTTASSVNSVTMHTRSSFSSREVSLVESSSGNIEKFFASGKSPYPVERTLLTSTVLDLGLHSLAERGRAIETPALDVHYRAPRESGFVRGRFTDAG